MLTFALTATEKALINRVIAAWCKSLPAILQSPSIRYSGRARTTNVRIWFQTFWFRWKKLNNWKKTKLDLIINSAFINFFFYGQLNQKPSWLLLSIGQLTRGERTLNSHCSGIFSHIVSSDNPLSRTLQYLLELHGSKTREKWVFINAGCVCCHLSPYLLFSCGRTEANTGVNGPD